MQDNADGNAAETGESEEVFEGYLIQDGGTTFGPHTIQQLRQMWSVGKITCDATYRSCTMRAWAPIEYLKDFLEPKTEVAQSPKPRKKIGGLKLAVGCCAGLIFVVGIVTKLSDDNKADQTFVVLKMKAEAKEAVLKNLKAPSTAKFSLDAIMDTDTEVRGYPGTTTYTVSGWVDSQNSYGAMLRNKFTVAVDYHDGQAEAYWVSVGNQERGNHARLDAVLNGRSR
jgi:hypothetical protein